MVVNFVTFFLEENRASISQKWDEIIADRKSIGEDEHLGISKQKQLISQKQNPENVSGNHKMTAVKPSQPMEKPRPDILSYNKPKTLAKDQGLYKKKGDPSVYA